jgi:gliding motility-associated-like protein
MIFVKPYYFVAFFAFLAIQVNGQFSVNLGEDKQLCYGEIVFLDAGIYGADYLWSTGDTTRTIKVIAPGSYSVAVIFEGVAASDEVQISFNPTVQNFKIPNVFSPNGDSVNDIFYPVTDEKLIPQYELSVFNRLGQRLFFSESPYIGWDGRTVAGEKVSSGTYYYVITYSPICDKGSIKGSITLK